MRIYMNTEIIIRMAKKSDAAELLNIYAPYVRDTAITFEYAVPTINEFSDRMQKTLSKYPYLVAVQNEEIIGYAYASTFKERAAYDWAVETTIYVKQEIRKSGVGKKLYQALEEVLKQQHVCNLYACIAYPNPPSIAFHERLGYQTIGHFSKCGYKFETWYDMIWMEKMIAEHVINPKPFIPVTALDD
ncbi:acetyltransferase GNAT family [Acetobacterium woodii DSM 1030]|uniref:Acetyltransferase GNAT family n=2 Tax=Acetobacterium woodii TaxID=33952 RepID=H6LHM0_ACEWD|nr:acetyltransferase GNAT family [Acetobacterium woodii DSM 1030]